MVKSVEVVALCAWYWWDVADRKWRVEEEDAVHCRASIGPSRRVVTVWLPRGAVIRVRLPRNVDDLFNRRYRHYYGYSVRQRIDIRLQAKPLNTGEML